MSKRRVQTHAAAEVTVGWVEVWTLGPEQLVRETAPLKLPSVTARFEGGRYRLRQRKALTLPETLS